jgi:L-lactate dehydrogenase complex protein LldG
MCSGSDLLPSHNFLPDDHIVIADCERIVRYQEDVWSLLRVDDHFPQRAVNLITGPSKTGDIEQTIQYGAHGPRRLHVLIVKD